MNSRNLKMIAFTVNSAMLAMVLGLMFFFKISGAVFLTYFSIPTAMVYLLAYYLIYKDELLYFVRLVFVWLTLYMGVTTICLGTDFGFHLYCFSMIPVAYTTEYMSYKINSKKVKALKISLAIAVFYLLCTGYVSAFGAVYENNKFASVFWLINSIAVLGYLIFYVNYLIHSIIRSEDLLKETAHRDRLTGLYNRHYAAQYLEALPTDETAGYLAIADIDDFKKINDVYGHNAGDIVLKAVSDKLKNVCDGSVTARWGGEEFLMLLPAGEANAAEVMERVRRDIGSETVTYQEHDIKVTITVGISPRQNAQSVDEWIQNVDEKLYVGKNSGKNKVVF